ncbi:MAG TPA: hypothetical protein VMS76_10395 [Planctomycetota bacterium]|nr:hypothetical protein [Planctomycetota bacterium]
MTDHDAHRPLAAEVNLRPAIQLESCSTYFLTEAWLGAKAALEARQKFLDATHDRIIRELGGKKVLDGWQDLKDAPQEVTRIGASVEEVRRYVARKLAELGKGEGETLNFVPTRCPPGATCRVDGETHIVTYGFKAMRKGRPWLAHEPIDGVDVCLDVRIELEVVTRMHHQPGGAPEHPTHAGATGGN